MSPYQVNPANSSIDIDGMTLDSYSVEKTPESFYQTKLWLSGGLGRIFISKIGNKLVDQNISVEAHGLFQITEEESRELKALLLSWEKVSPPLRFLDFGDRAMLLEDGDKFIVLPKGFRDIKFDMSAPFN
jgi:hypothetical protein